MGKKKQDKVAPPRVSSAWTPSLSIYHTESLLTNLDFERILRHTYGYLMLIKFYHSENIKLSELIFFQEYKLLANAPSKMQRPALAKIIRKYFTKNTSPVFIECPPDIVPVLTDEITDQYAAQLEPIVRHIIARGQELVFPRFTMSPFHASYDRFVTRSMTAAKIDDFEMLRCIGRGGFGKVHAVSRKDTGQMYALKALEKKEVIKQGMAEFVMRERTVLADLESPFIVNLVYAFQDKGFLYMCMDMMKGGDLSYQMGVLGKMSESTTRYYAVELACGLQYMHDKHYIHRDIKPQNIMFDQDGHMRITDMGLVVEYQDGMVVDDFSGTPGFISPEVLKGETASRCSDWWSLGVVLFEMVFAHHPYPAANHDEANEKILSGEAHIPDTISPPLQSLLAGLLASDPSVRIGKNGLADFKSHAFFAGVDWDAMLRRDINPPFIPSEKAHVNGAYDFEDQMAGPGKVVPISEADQAKLKGFDFVNPRAFTEEFFRVARAMQTDVTAV